VSFFALGLEIEDRDEIKVGNWAKHKKTFYFTKIILKNQCSIFMLMTFGTIGNYFHTTCHFVVYCFI
jgi:hypothetical protein